MESFEIQFNKDNKLYLITISKNKATINIYKENTEKCIFKELNISEQRLNEILRTY